MIKAQRGTVDILPSESYKWQFLENSARKVAKEHNISEVRTPTFEATELFCRGVGEGSDIVSKEMYTFFDKGERSITLKPEGTAGVARCGIEHAIFSDALPSKQYYLTSVFRYEKPQNGRLREHHQFGVEMFGSKSPKMDCEVILTALDFFKRVGINNVEIHLNSIGCEKCRGGYIKALREYFADKLGNMCEDCNRRYEKNALRILDCKVDICKNITQHAPSTLNFLCDDCKLHMKLLLDMLCQNNVNYIVDDRIVRGLDYYTKTVFEFVTTCKDGSKMVIGAGGRYDNLVSSLGGNDIPSIGFGIGLERILLILENNKIDIPCNNQLDCFILKIGLQNDNIDLKIAQQLRHSGLSADVDYMERGLRANLNYANKINANFALIIGEDELKQNCVNIKNMKTSEQKQICIDEIAKYILEQKNGIFR